MIFKVTMLPTEFSVDEESLEPILMENRIVQCVVQVFVKYWKSIFSKVLPISFEICIEHFSSKNMMITHI